MDQSNWSEESTEDDVAELRAEIQVGIEQSRRGESTPLDMAALKVQVRSLLATRANGQMVD